MTEEIMFIRSTVDDLRDSATEIERLIDAVGDDGNRLLDKIAWLKRENSKFKALVLDMWDAALHPETFGDGSHLLRRMREAGIEVE